MHDMIQMHGRIHYTVDYRNLEFIHIRYILYSHASTYMHVKMYKAVW